jgi:hypothetical protein
MIRPNVALEARVRAALGLLYEIEMGNVDAGAVRRISGDWRQEIEAATSDADMRLAAVNADAVMRSAGQPK